MSFRVFGVPLIEMCLPVGEIIRLALGCSLLGCHPRALTSLVRSSASTVCRQFPVVHAMSNLSELAYHAVVRVSIERSWPTVEVLLPILNQTE